MILLPLAWIVVGGCGGDLSGPDPGSRSVLADFTLTGDPASPPGATWTYRATTAGVAFDLTGILLRPPGPGAFPAVIVSHGAGGNANSYSRQVAATMVQWGMVVIATNYTHAGGVAVGLPGGVSEPGASAANVARTRKLVEILAALGYVDTLRIAAHGHSMGAFVTIATVAAHPGLFRVASHSAGGVRPESASGPAPSESQVTGIRTPYQMHHGDEDAVVPLASDERFAAVLSALGVAHELHVYPGAAHNEVSLSATVLDRVHAWYRAHGLF